MGRTEILPGGDRFTGVSVDNKVFTFFLSTLLLFGGLLFLYDYYEIAGRGDLRHYRSLDGYMGMPMYPEPEPFAIALLLKGTLFTCLGLFGAYGYYREKDWIRRNFLLIVGVVVVTMLLEISWLAVHT